MVLPTTPPPAGPPPVLVVVPPTDVPAVPTAGVPWVALMTLVGETPAVLLCMGVGACAVRCPPPWPTLGRSVRLRSGGTAAVSMA